MNQEESRKKTNDYKFHFENGIKKGRKDWKKGTGIGTSKGRSSFYIKHDYNVDYSDYSCLKGRKNNVFKYLLIEIM